MKLARLSTLHLPRPGLSPLVSVGLVVIVVALVFILFRDFDQSALMDSSRGAGADSSLVRLHVQADGTIRWNDEAAIPADALPTRLAEFAGRHRRGRVLVDGDADVRLGEIRRSLEAARAAGLRAATVEPAVRPAP